VLHRGDSEHGSLLYSAPVERNVKERLIGAAVLMAAAIILIPEMLSGPEPHSAQEELRATGEGATKTYTIDLDGSTNPSARNDEPIETAPPPEEPAQSAPPVTGSAQALAPPQTVDQTSPESAARSPTAELSKPAAPQPEISAPSTVSPSSSPVRSEPSIPTPPVSSPPRAPETTRRALASESTVPSTKGWAVQLGSFSNRDSAERLAREFQAERENAFVMPVQSGAATLYRVRLGPMKDRAAAEEALKRARAKIAGAAVVAHP
jgi:DedD protein